MLVYKNFTSFRGNEFLGYQVGINYFLKDIIDKTNHMSYMLNALKKRNVIKEGNISEEFRILNGEYIDTDAVKDVLREILAIKTNQSLKKIDEFIDKVFIPGIIERKMRFIDKYKIYQSRIM